MQSISRVIGLTLFLIVAATAHADINGFGNFSNFTINQGDSGGAPTINGDAILLTHGDDASRSIFCDTLQGISTFTASFTYQEANGNINNGPVGACFVLQNSTAGVHTFAGNSFGGGFTNFGYGDFQGSFNNSVAVLLEAGPNSTTLSGFYTDAANVGVGSLATTPVTFQSGDPINVTISYNGSVLQESLVDAITAASYSAGYLVNLPSDVGGSTAFVGFTAGTEGAADQTISNFQFSGTSVPEPATLGLMGAGVIASSLRRSRRRA